MKAKSPAPADADVRPVRTDDLKTPRRLARKQDPDWGSLLKEQALNLMREAAVASKSQRGKLLAGKVPR
jgi:hypothetical protein